MTCCPLPVPAADSIGNFEITPVAGYQFGGTFNIEGTQDAYELEDSSSFGLILNLRQEANTQWELLYSQQRTDASLESSTLPQNRVDLDIQTLQFGGTYQGPWAKIRPYVALTIGGTRIDAGSGSDSFFSGSIGAGLQVMPDARVGLRFEVRAYGTLTDSDTDLFCRTGPDQNICAIRIEGEVLGQIQTFAGVVFRF